MKTDTKHRILRWLMTIIIAAYLLAGSGCAGRNGGPTKKEYSDWYLSLETAEGVSCKVFVNALPALEQGEKKTGITLCLKRGENVMLLEDVKYRKAEGNKIVVRIDEVVYKLHTGAWHEQDPVEVFRWEIAADQNKKSYTKRFQLANVQVTLPWDELEELGTLSAADKEKVKSIVMEYVDVLAEGNLKKVEELFKAEHMVYVIGLYAAEASESKEEAVAGAVEAYKLLWGKGSRKAVVARAEPDDLEVSVSRRNGKFGIVRTKSGKPLLHITSKFKAAEGADTAFEAPDAMFFKVEGQFYFP